MVCTNPPENILTGVLEGSSARVLQCSPFPTHTGALFNSFSKQSCTYKLQLVSLSVSCRLLSRNSVQTNKELSLEPVGFFRHICFLGAGKYLTFYQYRQWNSAKLCIFLVGCHPSDWLLSFEKINSNRIRQVGTQDLALIGQLTGALHFWTVLVPKVSCRQSC